MTGTPHGNEPHAQTAANQQEFGATPEDAVLRCGGCGETLPLDKLFDHIHGECPEPWEVLEDADAE